MASIRFYKVDDEDWISKAVYWGGSFKYDMILTHCAFEFDGGCVELTGDGFSYYTLEDEAMMRKPMAVMYLNDDISEDTEHMYAVSEFMALTGVTVRLENLIKKALGQELEEGELLCTDIVPLMLGEEPDHLTPLEVLIKYSSDAYSLSVDESICQRLSSTLIAQGVEVKIT